MTPAFIWQEAVGQAEDFLGSFAQSPVLAGLALIGVAVVLALGSRLAGHLYGFQRLRRQHGNGYSQADIEAHTIRGVQMARAIKAKTGPPTAMAWAQAHPLPSQVADGDRPDGPKAHQRAGRLEQSAFGDSVAGDDGALEQEQVDSAGQGPVALPGRSTPGRAPRPLHLAREFPPKVRKKKGGVALSRKIPGDGVQPK